MESSEIPSPIFGDALYLRGEFERSPADSIAASSSFLVGNSIGARFCGVVCCTGLPHIDAALLTDAKLWFSLSASVVFSGGKGLSCDLEAAMPKLGRGLEGRGRLKPDGWRAAETGVTTFGIDCALTEELAEEVRRGVLTEMGVVDLAVIVDEGVRRGVLTVAGVGGLSETIGEGVLRTGFTGVTGLGFSAPAVVETSRDDLAETGVFGFSDWTEGNVIDFVGVSVFGFSVSATGGFERLMEAALTAADFGRGCTGVLVTGELGDDRSIDFAELMDEMRFSGSGVALTVSAGALDLGLRLLGPLARLLVMCVS